MSEANVTRLLTACGDRPMLYLFVLLCAETALRPNSEALWLQWQDVDLEAGYLRVRSERGGHRTKTGKSRSVPISPRLAVALREHFVRFRFSGSPWVFHHVTARRRARAGDRLGTLLHAFQNAACRAGLPAGLRPYDLRHTRLTRWAGAGHNLAKVQKAAGHASIRTTMIYVHLADEDLRSLVGEPAGDVPMTTSPTVYEQARAN